MARNTIFVIEDEPSIAEVVSLYLHRAGYQVQVFNHGQAAIDAMKQEMPELVILDIMLPGMDGLEITHWIRDRGDTPIIIDRKSVV